MTFYLASIKSSQNCDRSENISLLNVTRYGCTISESQLLQQTPFIYVRVLNIFLPN